MADERFGVCVKHGVEAYQPDPRVIVTGAFETCAAAVYLCGKIDYDSVF